MESISMNRTRSAELLDLRPEINRALESEHFREFQHIKCDDGSRLISYEKIYRPRKINRFRIGNAIVIISKKSLEVVEGEDTGGTNKQKDPSELVIITGTKIARVERYGASICFYDTDSDDIEKIKRKLGLAYN